MPARRSEDPALTEAEKRGEGAHEHWDEATRAAARPAPLGRSLPDRDNTERRAVGVAGDEIEDSSMACEDEGAPQGASDGQEATDR